MFALAFKLTYNTLSNVGSVTSKWMDQSEACNFRSCKEKGFPHACLLIVKTCSLQAKSCEVSFSCTINLAGKTGRGRYRLHSSIHVLILLIRVLKGSFAA